VIVAGLLLLLLVAVVLISLLRDRTQHLPVPRSIGVEVD
jgi:hypothetical protein